MIRVKTSGVGITEFYWHTIVGRRNYEAISSGVEHVEDIVISGSLGVGEFIRGAARHSQSILVAAQACQCLLRRERSCNTARNRSQK